VAEGIATGIDFPAAGFAASGAFVFEVNPEDLSGLTMQVSKIQFWTVLAKDLAIDLAVPSDEIAKQLVSGATKEYVMPAPVLAVAS
jgi:hypothetical protein